jgi:hypothetical protein
MKGQLMNTKMVCDTARYNSPSIISVCKEGQYELRLILSDTNEWILVEEVPVNSKQERQVKRSYDTYLE